ALQRGYTTAVEMDADGSHDPADLPAMLTSATTADLVIGSRYVRGGTTVGWPRRRRSLSRAGNRYAAALLGLSVRDATSGFRAWRSALLRRIDLDRVTSLGYCFQIEMT